MGRTSAMYMGTLWFRRTTLVVVGSQTWEEKVQNVAETLTRQTSLAVWADAKRSANTRLRELCYSLSLSLFC